MEWILRNEKRTPKFTRLREWPPKLPRDTLEGPASFVSKMQVITGVTWHNWNLNCLEKPILRWSSGLQKRDEQRDVEGWFDGVTYFKRFLRPHFITGVQAVFSASVHAVHTLLQPSPNPPLPARLLKSRLKYATFQWFAAYIWKRRLSY